MHQRGRLLMLLAAFFLAGCGRVVEDGQAGVRATFGRIDDQPLETGLHFYMPGVQWIEVWNVKTQEIKERAAVPSSEGLISTLDVSVLFNVPKDQATLVRRQSGRFYHENILSPYVREAIRNVVSGYEVKSLYSDKGRSEIGLRILGLLQQKLEPRGIHVQDVLLRDILLPPAFATSIEVKLRTEQEALQKEFELDKAKKDAEIQVARAQGIAESNKIIAESITDNYLRYQWIEGLQRNQMQVIYVPTEGGLPVLEAGRIGEYSRQPKP